LSSLTSIIFLLGQSLLKCPFPPQVWQLISLFLAVDIVDPLELAAGCICFLEVEGVVSGLEEETTRLGAGGGVGEENPEFRGVKTLLALILASSANCASASLA
jgi:hypothetical protein